MKWLSLLETAVSEAEGLPKNLTDLLSRIPYMTSIPMTQLEQLGSVTWGSVDTLELVGTAVPQFESPIIELIEQVHENYPRVVVLSDRIEITKLNKMVIINPKWRIAYLAILAWCEVHAPYYKNPELSDQQQMDQIIERLPFGFTYDMAELVELAIKLGWDLMVTDNYNTEDRSKPEPEQKSEITCWLPAVANCMVFRCNSGPACLRRPETEGYFRFTATDTHRWKPCDDRWIPVLDAFQKRRDMSGNTGQLYGHPIGPSFIRYRKQYD